MPEILLFGDTHGRIDNMCEAILASQGVDYLIHLGDCCRDAEELEKLTGRTILKVRGNNDYFELDIPEDQELSWMGHRIYICHGHRLHVYQGLNQLVAEARRRDCDLAFYGHTHVWDDRFVKGVHCLSPGSPTWPRDGLRSYALISLREGEVEVERKFL